MAWTTRTSTCSVIHFVLCFFTVQAWVLSTNRTQCDESNLYELAARRESGTVHALIAADNNIRPPALILLYSPKMSSKVEVNCTLYRNVSTFRNSVKAVDHTASYGLIFFQACLYDDGDDHAQIPPLPKCSSYYGSNLIWTASLSQDRTDNPSNVSVHLRGVGNTSQDTFLNGGAIYLNFTMYADEWTPSYASDYQVAGALHVRVDLAMDRVEVKDKWDRIAPRLYLFSNQSLEDNEDFLVSTVNTNSPLGMLQSNYLILNERTSAVRKPKTVKDAMPGFALFPPISYTSDPLLAHSKDVLRHASPGPRTIIKHKGRAHHFSHSLPYAFYGDRFDQVHQGSHTGHVGARDQPINLGDPKDGFYSATNYIAWTMVLGLGSPNIEPPNRSVSAAAIAIPVVLVVAALGGVLYYRRRRAAQWSNLIRIERMTPGPSAMLVPADDQPHEGIAMNDPNLPVEPSMARKLRFLLSRRSTNRTRRSSRSVTDPLLNEPPPSYDTIMQ